MFGKIARFFQSADAWLVHLCWQILRQSPPNWIAVWAFVVAALICVAMDYWLLHYDLFNTDPRSPSPQCCLVPVVFALQTLAGGWWLSTFFSRLYQIRDYEIKDNSEDK